MDSVLPGLSPTVLESLLIPVFPSYIYLLTWIEALSFKFNLKQRPLGLLVRSSTPTLPVSMFHLHVLLCKAMLIFVKTSFGLYHPPARNVPTEFPSIWCKIQSPPFSKALPHLPPCAVPSMCWILNPTPFHLLLLQLQPSSSSMMSTQPSSQFNKGPKQTPHWWAHPRWPSSPVVTCHPGLVWSQHFSPLAYIFCNTTITYFSRMHTYKKWEFVVFIFHFFTPSAWCGNSQNIGWVCWLHTPPLTT